MKKRPNDTSKFPPARRATVAPVRPVKGGAPRPITPVPSTVHPIATEPSLSSSTAISPADRADPVITATPETIRGEAETATASPFAALPGKIAAASKAATNQTGAAPKRENSAQQSNPASKEKEKEKEREKCPFRRLIGRWVNDCRTDGLSETTLHDYADKASKFWWWWTEHTRYSQKLGAHPENVTTKEAREFASYLREKLDSRWGLPVPLTNSNSLPLR